MKYSIIIILCVFTTLAMAQNVGISNLNPSEKLHVDSGAIKIGVDVWDSSKTHMLKFGDINYVTIGESTIDDRLELKAKEFIFLSSAPNLGYTGNVGIGTVVAPTAKLEVAGQVKITGGAPGLNKVLTSDTNGLATWQSPPPNTWTQNGANINNNNTGNIGVGTSVAPVQKLEVNGAIKIGNTSTANKGTMRYNTADSSFEFYDHTRWKNVGNNFSVKGGLKSCGTCNGTAPYFTSMVRSSYVELTHLRDTIEKSGNYLIMLSSNGTGVYEPNDIYNLTDNRTDISGQIRVCPNLSAGNSALITQDFFYSIYGNTSGVYTAIDYIHNDSEKSMITYLTAGDVIKTFVFISQTVGPNAPAQVNGWWVEAQVKFILLN